MILFEFFIAYSFIQALPKIVIPAINELTRVEIKIARDGLWIIAETESITDAPPAPLKIPQISPITSAQKEHTFSEFLAKESPTLAPLILFLSFSSKKDKEHDVTAIPIISKTILTKMNIQIVITAVITPNEVSIVWLIKLKTDERQSANINIFNAHLYFFNFMFCTFTFSSFFMVIFIQYVY